MPGEEGVSFDQYVGGEGTEKSYYAREGGTYEIQWSGVRNGGPKKFGIDEPKSIETESFPSSDGME